jgi:3-dehydroquinate dehydratase
VTEHINGKIRICESSIAAMDALEAYIVAVVVVYISVRREDEKHMAYLGDIWEAKRDE